MLTWQELACLHGMQLLKNSMSLLGLMQTHVGLQAQRPYLQLHKLPQHSRTALEQVFGAARLANPCPERAQPAQAPIDAPTAAMHGGMNGNGYTLSLPAPNGAPAGLPQVCAPSLEACRIVHDIRAPCVSHALSCGLVSFRLVMQSVLHARGEVCCGRCCQACSSMAPDAAWFLLLQMLSGLQYNGGAISYQLPGGVTLNSDGSLHPQAQILLAALAAQVRHHRLCCQHVTLLQLQSFLLGIIPGGP